MKNHNKVQSNKIHIFSIFITPFYQKNIFIINYLLYRDNKILVNCFFKIDMHSRYVWRTQLHQKCLKFRKITFLRQGGVFNSFRSFRDNIQNNIQKPLHCPSSDLSESSYRLKIMFHQKESIYFGNIHQYIIEYR